MAILKVSSGSSKPAPKPVPKSDAVQAAQKQASNAKIAAMYDPKVLGSGFKGVSSTNYPAPTTSPPPPVKVGSVDSGPSSQTEVPYIPPTPPPPPPPPVPPTAKDLGVVKTPGRDVTRISDLVQQTPADTIKRLAFEQLSAIELSQFVTSNTVDGINQRYSIISNLSDIRRRFDASKQLSIMNKLSPMTGVFTIDIESKIPDRKYILDNNLDVNNYYVDTNSASVAVEKGHIYIESNGDLVIEFDNIKKDEIAQVQINSDGTIYEVI